MESEKESVDSDRPCDHACSDASIETSLTSGCSIEKHAATSTCTLDDKLSEKHLPGHPGDDITTSHVHHSFVTSSVSKINICI